ncbi:kinase D-interacting substrate of 220 kDa-like [Mytilus trossulus]|uniref:kinase D-interacting substrate of 220 kDa-like n=1 Tax=Mytilus trossulus TaxID=6551 RepID=UPI003004E9C5
MSEFPGVTPGKYSVYGVWDGFRKNCTKLTRAARKGDIDALELSLQNGADIDYQDVDGQTALMWAANGGHLEICRLLIDRGCKINITETEYSGETALIWAVVRGHLDICRLLIDRGCKIDTTTRDGYTALHWAARKGYLQITRCLVEQGGASPLVTTHKSPAGRP